MATEHANAVRASMTSPAKPARYGLSPKIVFFEVTQACDLVCLHCRACAQPGAHPEELSAARAEQLIEQIAEFPQRPLLVLTGGDPLKRRDIFSLIERGVAAGLEVSITPSATPLVTGPVIARLRRAGISRMAVSLDAADPGLHDAIRGVPGSYRRTMWMLGEARAAGISTQVNTTLTPSNVAQIDEMADLLAVLGVSMWSVFFLVPVGRAAGAPRLSAARCELAFRKLWRQSLRQPFWIKTTEAPHYRRYVLGQRGSLRQAGAGPEAAGKAVGPIPSTNDGKGILFVSHVGAIYPSGFLPIECGRFPRDHLVDVYQCAPLLCGLRDASRLEGKCGCCEYRHICGGSRARAYAVAGNPFAEEPDCSYAPCAAVPS